MRRFVLYTPEQVPAADRQAWLDAGFVAAGVKEKVDVVYWPECPDQGEFAAVLAGLFPRIYVVAGSRAPSLPAGLAADYVQQVFTGEGLCFYLGRWIDPVVAVPVWDGYRDEAKVLPRPVQVKAVADVVWRALLADVFQETADWCGHMSSVVGPM
ncbi:MAG: hypothetical protein PHC60_04410 [Heliobacteriaceae bacterium]|nr:hypothetical protein [Heliobacteriaceae bacterium]